MSGLQKFIGKVYSFDFDLEPEASSLILRFGWVRNPKSTTDNPLGVLKIVFKTNHICYYYNDVPLNIFEDFVNSDSYGKFFHKNIFEKYNFIKSGVKEQK